MQHSESIAQLAVALAKAQGEMKPAKKDAENPFFKSTYADLAAVREAYQEPFAKHGLSIVQVPSLDAGHVILTTMLLHASGEWIKGDLTMKLVKDDPQAIGSCITYARRYAASAMAGVATEDDDAEAAQARPATPKPAYEPRKPAASPSQPSDDGLVTVEGRIGSYTPQVGNKPGQFELSTMESDIIIGFWKAEMVQGITEGHDLARCTYAKKVSKAGKAYNDLVKPIEWLPEVSGQEEQPA